MSAAEAVARGAALLDEREPGWARRINLDILYLSDCDKCVLGQMFGAEAVGWGDPSGYDLGLARLGLIDGFFGPAGARDADLFGFTLRDPASPEDARWAELRALWTAEILRRLGGAR